MKAAIASILLALSAALSAHADVLTAANAARENYPAQMADATLRTSDATVTAHALVSPRLYFTSGTNYEAVVLVFQLPDLAGKPISSAILTVGATKSNPHATYNQAVDLYGVRYKANTAVLTDTDVLYSDLPAQIPYAASNNGVGIMNNFLPPSTSAAADGDYSTDAGASSALGAWLQAQYNAGAQAGDYVFLRLNPDTHPYGSSNWNSKGWKILAADSPTDQPELTITTVAEIDEPAYLVSAGDNWDDGTVRYPSSPMRVGRANTVLSASVMYFDLPDLKGASILSAKLKFRADSVHSGSANMDVIAIRGTGATGERLSSDFTGFGASGTEELIQADIAKVSDGTFPRDYETSEAAGLILGDWLADQYTSVGIGGLVFLRLAPDANPNVNTKYFSIPTDSLELIITTDGNTDPVRGYGDTVSARIANKNFSWTFDRDVEWGKFIDGQPWVQMPAGGVLNLVSATPARLNNQTVYVHNGSTVTQFSGADINITVKNPPIENTYNTTTGKYVYSANGVFGWDERAGHMSPTASPQYNPALGWNGITPMPLAVGDSITTPSSMTGSDMPSRATMLDALGVVTVLADIPPEDAFRPGVLRGGTDRTNPEILCYSDLINLNPYLIPSPVDVTTDLAGADVTAIPSQYSYYRVRACLNGPWFMNTGTSNSEGVNAMYNNYTLPGGSAYGGSVGGYMGQVAIGTLASWFTEEQRKSCRIRYVQRAIDVYTAVRAGLCLEESAGILPGYSTLLTAAGVMMNHTGMKNVNHGVNGVEPWWIFADFASMYHTDGVPSSDLANGESSTDRLIPLYSATTTDYPELNRTGVTPIASGSGNTMTMKTTFRWSYIGRPINNIVNLKFKITSGAGSGPTIYTITEAIVTGVSDAEKFRTTSGTLYNGTGNTYNYVLGGKVRIKPSWQNGNPSTSSVVGFSTFARDADNPDSENAKWYYNVVGVDPTANPVKLDKVNSVCVSPNAEYASIHAGGCVDNLITLYALNQPGLYRGGLDKYMIHMGGTPGYGEALFGGTYLDAMTSGSTGNMRGALWKQEVLNPLSKTFIYTGQGTLALPAAQSDAKLWFEP